MWKEFIIGYRSNGADAGTPDFKRIPERGYVNLSNVLIVQEETSETYGEDGEWEEEYPCIKLTLSVQTGREVMVRIYEKSYEEVIELVKLLPRNYKGA